jgi:hypothetical protein
MVLIMVLSSRKPVFPPQPVANATAMPEAGFVNPSDTPTGPGGLRRLRPTPVVFGPQQCQVRPGKVHHEDATVVVAGSVLHVAIAMLAD